MSDVKIGFAGLGVMGEPICRNMLTKSGAAFRVFDLNQAPLARLESHGAVRASSIAEIAAEVDIIFLSLPGGPQVEAVIEGPEGVLEAGRSGQLVVDMSTAPVSLTRRLAEKLAGKGIDFADAPVARTRQAAENGTLSIMVGAEPATFQRVHRWLEFTASDVTHCGPVGCGQVTKILNNMVLFENVVALSEALAIGKAAGMDPDLLFSTLSKGSADSFALRNHGMKAMLPGNFPKGAFSTIYAMKDASYALELAQQAGIETPGAALAQALLERALQAGYGEQYFPVLSLLSAGPHEESSGSTGVN